MKKDNDLEFGETDWESSDEPTRQEKSHCKLTNDKSIDDTLDKSKLSKEVHAVPTDWTGWNKAEKLQYLLEVIQYQIQKVRSGNFDLSKAEAVAALSLEGQIELAEYYAEAESYAKDAKNLVEYTEAEISERISNTAFNEGKKITEASLKRKSGSDQIVLQAKKHLTNLDKECKKWRYIYDTLRDAHIFFRNLGKA